VSEVSVNPVFLPEAVEEAHADGNEWFLRAELYAVFALGVLDRWVSRRKLARLLCELARRDWRIRRSIDITESECYENLFDIITAPLYLDKAFEYKRSMIRLSEFGEVIFNEFTGLLSPERFFELKQEVLEIWEGSQP